MLPESANIISGPKEDISIPEGSVGKYFLDCMKKRDPKHVTLVDFTTGNTLINQQLLQYSLRATRIFQGLGIKKGDIISIVAENSLKYCVPELGALYIGAVVHLLNPHYSIGELKHALSITKPKLIICSELSVKNVMQVHKDLQPINSKIVLLENKSENYVDIITFEDLLNVVPHIDPDSFEPEEINTLEDGAFILMSSGTTGLPKGVLITHDNLRAALNYLCHENYLGVSDEDTTIFLLPFFHIFGVLIQMLFIACGMKAVILNKFKPDIFLTSIEKYKATKLFVVPPIILFFAKSPLVDDYNLSSVKDIVVGGAPLGKDLQENVTNRIKNATVRQIYGLSETCGACTFQTYNKIKLNSVGVLVPHLYAKVWDPQLKQSLGVGKVGELCFKGSMVMKGYYRNMNFTKECIDEDGYYHSGDIGYYDEDGNIYVVDRLKELIKYKGFQVPPAELEALILTHPAVKDCGVIGIPDERAGEIPLAYIVKQNEVQVGEQDIVDYVAERISVQKHLYGGVKFIEEIPKTASGKILRRKLRERFWTSL
ncbi:hypothetical protein ILUMI_11394 [Ignelater luminosus]|uniref:Luciferin 4-monooxygenase n=1 Tax=Ignelater luminosus TaxID=2038154 RepID=A0A8K0GDZ6_IGNLU|nr:hypothetical protein ILUMI_11394 [Ignelater luminosus]